MKNEIRILKDLKIEIWYSYINKTVYIKPPVKARHLVDIKKMLKYYNLDIENIVVGRLYEGY